MTSVKQLFEILQKHNRLDLLEIYSDVAIENSYVVLKSKVPIEKDDKIRYLYYFYHHLDKEFPKSKVLQAIENKDFETFNSLHDEWYFKHNLTYLPSAICLFNETKDEPIGIVNGIWLKDIFELIDFAEYECG